MEFMVLGQWWNVTLWAFKAFSSWCSSSCCYYNYFNHYSNFWCTFGVWLPEKIFYTKITNTIIECGDRNLGRYYFLQLSNTFSRARLDSVRHVTNYFPAKIGEHLREIPKFLTRVWCEKYLQNNKHNNLHLAGKMPGYLTLVIICTSSPSRARSVFPELRSQKTVRFSEPIMPPYKYSSLFPRQIETIDHFRYIRIKHGSEA